MRSGKRHLVTEGKGVKKFQNRGDVICDSSLKLIYDIIICWIVKLYFTKICFSAKQDGEEASQEMMASMAQSVRGSLIHQSPTPMFTSMNVPHFTPPETSASTLTASHDEPSCSNPGMEPTLMTDKTIPSPQEEMPPLQVHVEIPPSQDQEEMLPPQDMSTTLSQKRYIFDEQYTQIEQSYRETRQPITMSESVSALARKNSETQPISRCADVSGRNSPPASGFARSMADHAQKAHIGMSSMSQSRLINSVSFSQLINSDNFMSMSTLDASMFLSASPHLEHAQWAASSSLSQGLYLSYMFE